MDAYQLSEAEYNSYYQRYIDQASQLSLLKGLAEGLLETHHFFDSIPENKHEYRYAEGKWTPKDILLHIIDTERVFAYRALQFARAENVVLPGFDQDEFAANSHANSRSMSNLLEEYISVRTSTVALFTSFSSETLLQKGIASDSVLSVRAAGYIISGHEKHHIQVLTERYL